MAISILLNLEYSSLVVWIKYTCLFNPKSFGFFISPTIYSADTNTLQPPFQFHVHKTANPLWTMKGHTRIYVYYIIWIFYKLKRSSHHVGFLEIKTLSQGLLQWMKTGGRGFLSLSSAQQHCLLWFIIINTVRNLF